MQPIFILKKNTSSIVYFSSFSLGLSTFFFFFPHLTNIKESGGKQSKQRPGAQGLPS